jgi:Flp pilus assembly protein CpaB
VAVSAQRRRRALVAVVAALIAAGAFYLAMEYAGKTPATTPVTGTSTTTASSPPVQTITVVEASIAIPQGQAITATDLKTAPVAVSDLPQVTAGTTPPYFTSTLDLTATTEYAAIKIPADTVLLSTMVTTSQSAIQAPVGGTNFDIPSGDVALALPYSPSAGKGEIEGDGTGGYIVAGDRIDILVEVDPIPNPNNELGTMYWAYQNVPVLAVGVSSGAPVTSSSSTTPGASPSASAAPTAAVSASLIMVQLPRQDAANLAYMEDAANVTLQYLIVSSSDYNSSSAPVPTPNSQSLQPVTASGVVTQLGG